MFQCLSRWQLFGLSPTLLRTCNFMFKITISLNMYVVSIVQLIKILPATGFEPTGLYRPSHQLGRALSRCSPSNATQHHTKPNIIFRVTTETDTRRM